MRKWLPKVPAENSVVLKLLQALNSFVGMILALVIIGLLVAGGWFAFQNYYADKFALEADLAAKQEEVDQLAEELMSSQAKVGRLEKDVEVLNEDLEKKRQEIQRLSTALKFMKVDQRLARITVLSQDGSAATKDLATRFSFVEVDHDGNPLGEPRIFNVEGDLAYIDSWVIKFGDEYVEQGDDLRSTSICLFRRVFGENQLPSEGFLLDEEGTQPTVYRTGGKMSDFEKGLWSRFWDYANDTEMAEEQGVRAAHGEAPSIQLRPGKSYRIELRASGGISVVPEDAPDLKETSLLN
jgi:outer membrane murein-binding lipoprotein Lpp